MTMRKGDCIEITLRLSIFPREIKCKMRMVERKESNPKTVHADFLSNSANEDVLTMMQENETLYKSKLPLIYCPPHIRGAFPHTSDTVGYLFNTNFW
jgi:hypothetical protein